MLKTATKLFLAAALVATSALAQTNPLSQRLTGNWLVSVTVDGAHEPFTIETATYRDDGTYTVISSDHSESNGVGSWGRIGNREFLSTHAQILYNEKGTFAGIAKVIAQIKLGESGDTFTGRFRVEISTATGEVVAKVTGSITGKLVVPEPL